MKIVGYLKKQPKWGCTIDAVTGRIHTGWVGDSHLSTGSRYIYDSRTEKFIANPDYQEPEISDIEVPVAEGRLHLDYVGRGRSSVVFHFKDGLGNEYQSAPKASLEMFKKTINGEIQGLFTFIKQGDSISVIPIDPDKHKWN